jgi:hypothetical protein
MLLFGSFNSYSLFSFKCPFKILIQKPARRVPAEHRRRVLFLRPLKSSVTDQTGHNHGAKLHERKLRNQWKKQGKTDRLSGIGRIGKFVLLRLCHKKNEKISESVSRPLQTSRFMLAFGGV